MFPCKSGSFVQCFGNGKEALQRVSQRRTRRSGSSDSLLVPLRTDQRTAGRSSTNLSPQVIDQRRRVSFPLGAKLQERVLHHELRRRPATPKNIQPQPTSKVQLTQAKVDQIRSYQI